METPATMEEVTTEPELHSLDPRTIRMWRITMAAWLATFALVPLVLGILVGPLYPLLAVAVLVALSGLVLAARWPAARYRAWGYRIREDDVMLHHGVLWKTVSVVPHARIQHVDTQRGPLERALGLATVTVHTAGSVGAVMSIPGVDAGEAEVLRDRIAALSGKSDAI
ncbi:MAG: PH domain-containing protein [Gemmatimonadaceae bacterium]